MKRLLIVICASSLVISAGAQTKSEQANIPANAFNLGFEASTTGLGIDISVPVIKNLVKFNVGFNAFVAPAYSGTFDMTANRSATQVAETNTRLAGTGMHISSPVPTAGTIDATAVATSKSVKGVFEIFPFKGKGFHVDAGVHFGLSSSILDMDGCVDDKFWSEYRALHSEIDAINQKLPADQKVIVDGAAFNLMGKSYAPSDEAGQGWMHAQLCMVSRIRPYVGIGGDKYFGESQRFGMQFNAGMLFSKYSIASVNEITYNSEYRDLGKGAEKYLDMFANASAFPVLSIKLLYRIK